MAAPSLTDNYTFFATCPRSTEDLLLNELCGLGTTNPVETRGGVGFTGSLAAGFRACLWSRIASRILLRMVSFPVSTVDDLYEGVCNIAWEDHLSCRGTLAVDVTSTIARGPLAALNTHFAEQRVKDAVVDRLRQASGTRPSVNLSRPDLRINVHLSPLEAGVSLDLSGESLHRRGYRLEGGEAPLRENLAAAILLRSGWPAIAAAGGALLDPMCGSGTLLIEGALMAGDVAPALSRDYFGFLGWKGFQPRVWHTLVEEAADRRGHGLAHLPPLFGFDLDPRAIGTARSNARRAGLAGRISFERRDLSSLTSPRPRPAPLHIADTHQRQAEDIPAGIPTEENSHVRSVAAGLLVTNPPYGKRLGQASELISLYETLGERLRKSFSGWEAAVFTGNPELGAYLGLRARRTNVFYNGPLPCKLLLFTIDPHRYQTEAWVNAGRPGSEDGTTPGPPSRGGSRTGPGVEMFVNRLHKNLRHLRRWVAREGITCYRLYDADLPEYAVALDLYGEWAHVQEYSPPRTVDPVRARRRLKELVEAIPPALDISPDHLVLKVRQPQRGSDQYQRRGDEGRFVEVEEGGLRFFVNLTDYLDTGLFLDHRITRAMIRELARGRRFLNLFAYTGTATVYAAAGGAISTTSVDLSANYLDWARRNLQLNGLSGAQHRLMRTDCLEWLSRESAMRASHDERRGQLREWRPGAGSPDGIYDLIFLDAPTFSNSKSMAGTLDIQRDHKRLIREAFSLLASDGVLIFSTNFRRFKLDLDVEREFEVADITKETIPRDFSRSPRIHVCYRIGLKGTSSFPESGGKSRAS